MCVCAGTIFYYLLMLGLQVQLDYCFRKDKSREKEKFDEKNKSNNSAATKTTATQRGFRPAYIILEFLM